MRRAVMALVVLALAECSEDEGGLMDYANEAHRLLERLRAVSPSLAEDPR